MATAFVKDQPAKAFVLVSTSAGTTHAWVDGYVVSVSDDGRIRFHEIATGTLTFHYANEDTVRPR